MADRIAILGLGLIGGSLLLLRLTELGHDVVGYDTDPANPRSRWSAYG
ncbi:hypothetical protein [Fodinicola feengrottensis]|nr:hypothetical protein [Fodinicola feengrottensis]